MGRIRQSAIAQPDIIRTGTMCGYTKGEEELDHVRFSSDCTRAPFDLGQRPAPWAEVHWKPFQLDGVTV